MRQVLLFLISLDKSRQISAVVYVCFSSYISWKCYLVYSLGLFGGFWFVFFKNTSNSWKACNRHGIYSLSITLNCHKRFGNNTDLCVSEIKEGFLSVALPLRVKEVFCKMWVMWRMNGTWHEAAGRSQAQCEAAACEQSCVLWKAGTEG